MSDADVRWSTGGEARIVSLEAGTLVLRSTVASPPGSRLEGALLGGERTRLRLKIHGCRRRTEGDFVLHARPLDLRRDERAALEALVSARAAGEREAP